MRLKVSIFISTILLILVSSALSGQTTEVAAEHYQTVNYDVAIFPGNTNDLLPSAVHFTPGKKEIDLAEAALIIQLKDINADKQNQYNTPIIDKNLKKYKRQYFGYLDSNGNKILFINFFWRKDKEEIKNWLSELVSVLDGGSYYWNVKYNISKNELFDLNVNANP